MVRRDPELDEGAPRTYRAAGEGGGEGEEGRKAGVTGMGWAAEHDEGIQDAHVAREVGGDLMWEGGCQG